MENALIVALIISAIGMTLLFLALTFFYGLLTLATRAFRDRAPATGAAAEEADEQEATLLAAALAVSLARAEGEGIAAPGERPAWEERPSALPSAWWTLHQQRNWNLGASAWRAP